VQTVTPDVVGRYDVDSLLHRVAPLVDAVIMTPEVIAHRNLRVDHVVLVVLETRAVGDRRHVRRLPRRTTLRGPCMRQITRCCLGIGGSDARSPSNGESDRLAVSNGREEVPVSFAVSYLAMRVGTRRVVLRAAAVRQPSEGVARCRVTKVADKPRLGRQALIVFFDG
jgi:hypothetical protein